MLRPPGLRDWRSPLLRREARMSPRRLQCERQGAADAGESDATDGGERAQRPSPAGPRGRGEPRIGAREDGPDEVRFLVEREVRELDADRLARPADDDGRKRALLAEGKDREPDPLAADDIGLQDQRDAGAVAAQIDRVTTDRLAVREPE